MNGQVVNILLQPLRLLLFVFILVSSSYAVTTGKFHQSSQQDFDTGEPENVSITSDGTIMLSPCVEKIAGTDELYVWSLTSDDKGNLYAGTGNEGRIYKIKGGEAILLYDSTELEIQSLAVDKKGNLYAGTSPEGIIYKISSDGNTAELCNLPDLHIWCLTFGSNGNLYA